MNPEVRGANPGTRGASPGARGASALRKLAGWVVVLLFAWLMSKWVYRHTNEQNCRARGGVWDAGADTCAHPSKARAR
ncbi:MAG: hypothetical protein JF616_04710 [Fibrobacteres bacterium]|nr:hypothetical protein [Fibrobacterota bacterium]